MTPRMWLAPNGRIWRVPEEKKDIEDAHSEEVAIQKEEVVYKGECHRWLIITVIVLG